MPHIPQLAGDKGGKFLLLTQVYGSWLNIAEIELSVLMRQCLCWRIPDIETLRRETQA